MNVNTNITPSVTVSTNLEVTSLETLYSELDPSTWKVTTCNWFYDLVGGQSGLLLMIFCDEVCHKY